MPPLAGGPVPDAATLAAPISQYVLKVHSRCDLACDHCYVYEHADQSWRGRPRAIAPGTVERAAARIAHHAAAHRLPEVHVILHGGEPLLLGPRRLRAVLAELHDRIAPVTRLDLRIHTNGVLLSAELCELFDEYHCMVGVSLDGDRAANDRHRRFGDGRSSHPEALRALALLRGDAYRHLYAGILCTVDIANDPVAVYRALRAERPPRLDFLLPHATWDHPPPRPGGRPTAYADWLGRVFDLWAAEGRPMPVRVFDAIESTARGGPSGTESVGLDPVDVLVIETDGDWEQVDSLKTAFDGAAATGMSVFDHSADQAAAHPAVAARQRGAASLSAACRACRVVDSCGGGLYAHRYRTGSGFDNPSVYCADLMELVTRIGAPRAATPVQPPEEPGPAAGHDLAAADLDALADAPAGPRLSELFAQSQLSAARGLFAAVGGGGGGGGGGGAAGGC
jgi:uncharacterized protein